MPRGLAVSEHIFEILGVGTHEDSYTALIAHAFKRDGEFRHRFLQVLSDMSDKAGKQTILPADDWECQTKHALAAGAGRKRNIPDLVIFSKKTGQIIVVENKLHSGEGADQTKRYASNECRGELANRVKSPQPSFHFFFLTLEGDRPQCAAFVPLSYEALLPLVESARTRRGKLATLLQEFHERVAGYYGYPKLDTQAKVLEYLNREESKPEHALVTERLRFAVLALSVRLDDEFKRNPGLTGRRDCGYIPLCEFYKPSWRGEPLLPVACQNGDVPGSVEIGGSPV